MKKRTGWAIATSATLVLIAGGAVILYYRHGSLGDPSPAIKTKMSPIAFTPDFSPIVHVPKGFGAEAAYDRAVHRAAALGTVASFPVKTIQALEPETDVSLRPVLDDLITGGQSGIADDAVLQFSDLPTDGPHESEATAFLVSLVTLPVNAANSIARDATAAQAHDPGNPAAAEKKWDQAIEIADAGLVFSSRLWSHGITWPQRQAGLVGMSKALAELKSIYTLTGRSPLADAVNKIEIERAAAAKTWDAKSRFTFLHSPLDLHPADLLYMATHDEDRTWRLEAVKWLGVARYSGAAEQTREIINHELDDLTGSHDDALAAAAREARDLGIDDVHRMLNE